MLEAIVQDRAASVTPSEGSGSGNKRRFSTFTRIWARLRAAVLLWLVWLTFPLSVLLVVSSVTWGLAKLLWHGNLVEVERRLLSSFRRRPSYRGTALVSGADLRLL